MNGDLDLRTALFALVLAPEAFIPLRQLGANYHASAEGMAAAEQVFAVLEAPQPPRRHAHRLPRPRGRRHRGRWAVGRLPGPRRAGTRRRLADGAGGRGAGGCRPERLWQVDPAGRPARTGHTAGRLGPRRWRRPRRPGPRGVAIAAGVGAPATASVQSVDRAERAPRPPRGIDRGGLGRDLRRRPGRRGAKAPGGPGHRARRPGARDSPRASDSGWRWRARSCATRPCCCSTSRPPTSTETPSGTSLRRSADCRGAARSCSWHIDRP